MLKADRQETVRTLIVSGESDIETIRRQVKAKFGRNVQKSTIAADIAEIQGRSKLWAERLATGEELVKAQLFGELALKCMAIMYDTFQRLGDGDSAKNAYRMGQLWPQIESSMKFCLDLDEKYPMYLQGMELTKRALASGKEEKGGDGKTQDADQ